MKAIVINKQGSEWKFDSVKEAKSYINPESHDDFTEEKRDGEMMRVYDTRPRNVYGELE